jgi:hypothetical protein
MVARVSVTPVSLEALILQLLISIQLEVGLYNSINSSFAPAGPLARNSLITTLGLEGGDVFVGVLVGVFVGVPVSAADVLVWAIEVAVAFTAEAVLVSAADVAVAFKADAVPVEFAAITVFV